MKKIAVISFTKKGSQLAEKIRSELSGRYEITLFEKYKKSKKNLPESLEQWTGQQFETQDGIVFVGATGIAVRAIAPFVREKAKDPAVIAVDEHGFYCIPLLSGHLGGANELAEIIAGKIGALAVITTATDLNHKWAVDVFAKKNRLWISDLKKAKEISARILNGEKLFIYLEKSCRKIRGELPGELEQISDLHPHVEETAKRAGMSDASEYGTTDRVPDIVIGIQNNPAWEQALYLVPRTVTLGIGCRREISGEQIEIAIQKVLEQYRIFPESIEKLASIDLKREERGILFCSEKNEWKYETFSSDALQGVTGDFTTSSFVRSVTGVDNVCERSAVCASSGELLVPKQAKDGVTVAAAIRKRSIQFE